MASDHPPQPTADQCNSEERVADFEGQPAFACWYPQMGGYVARCVIVLSKCIDFHGAEPHWSPGGCFEAFVWHDGEFPFAAGDDRSPARIHHCMASQFINFGQSVRRKYKELASQGTS